MRITSKKDINEIAKKAPVLFKMLLRYEKKISGLEKYLTPATKRTLTKEILRPTLRNVRNLSRAKEIIEHFVKRKNSVLGGIKDIDEFIKEIIKSPQQLLILLSYCSKPTHCPSRRFSERCQPIASDRVCDNCPFKKIILKARKIGCTAYIVFKTKKMVEKYLSPNLRKFRKTGKYRPIIVTACPFALKRFLEIAIISGFKGIGYQFIKGVCKTSRDYDRAGKGRKTKVTELRQKDWQEINYILDKVLKQKN